MPGSMSKGVGTERGKEPIRQMLSHKLPLWAFGANSTGDSEPA